MKLPVMIAGSLALALGACRDPYRPSIQSEEKSYLVVEGLLLLGDRPTRIRLSRTFMLDDTARLRWEDGAQVLVENRQGDVKILNRQAEGEYVHPNLELRMNEEYRVRIRTTNGDEFESDYVKPKLSPPIDSIGWELDEDGLTVYVNSFDPAGEARYYLWDYGETYEIHSYYFADQIYEDYYIRPRRLPEEQVYQCWKYDSSVNIILATTSRLEEDSLLEAPVAYFNRHDEKLSVRYSMLLRQYAIAEEAYQYLALMRQNTEQIGTIFDPQPTDIRGNIRCVNKPEDPVIGFVTASSVQERRKFISNAEVAPWRYQQYCPPDTIQPRDVIERLHGGGWMVFQAIMNPTLMRPSSYVIAFPFCVDCRNRGGDLNRPAFW